MVEDFQELQRSLEAMNMFKANRVFLFLHLAQILILETLAWLMVWHFGNGWLVTILISFLLVISQGQSSFLQHDTGHLSMFTKSKWNHLMQKFLLSHLKGLSTKWWNYQHFQHHVKPNIYPKDPDINVGPVFLVGDLQPVKDSFPTYTPRKSQKLFLSTRNGPSCVSQTQVANGFLLPRPKWLAVIPSVNSYRGSVYNVQAFVKRTTLKCKQG
ncbi:hypothetical protein GH733_007445 [Mirounga leonina]|nr:hypothetical protein GH733_007445 [Mirounga leonina]